ncbi:mechanosensitive ion channel [bacterium]|nr:MAG: mechanosensitive ion channel [bacterium]
MGQRARRLSAFEREGDGRGLERTDENGQIALPLQIFEDDDGVVGEQIDAQLVDFHLPHARLFPSARALIPGWRARRREACARSRSGSLALLADLLHEHWIVAILYAVAALIVARFGAALIRRLFAQRLAARLVPRAATIAAVASSLWYYVVALSGLAAVLNVFGIDLTALLEAAGIAGIAVALGAQTLIRDWLAGFFILAENQMSVDDYVATAGVEGLVLSIGLRATKLRDARGRLVIVPNGQIATLTNYTRGSTASVEFALPLKDVDLEALCADVRACVAAQGLGAAGVTLSKVEGGYGWLATQFSMAAPTPDAVSAVRLTLVAALAQRGWKLYPT